MMIVDSNTEFIDLTDGKGSVVGATVSEEGVVRLIYSKWGDSYSNPGSAKGAMKTRSWVPGFDYENKIYLISEDNQSFQGGLIAVIRRVR